MAEQAQAMFLWSFVAQYRITEHKQGTFGV